jgi:hypothetical protein
MRAEGKMGEPCRRKLATVRSLIVALAAERYRRQHDGWPETLDHLIPTYLAAVPLDPFDGKSLRYRHLDDGVVIYSVGADGKDNGGTLIRPGSYSPEWDVGIRLWDVKHRRQPPPSEKLPMPSHEPD